MCSKYEAKLCPNCPLGKSWINQAIKRIKEREIIKTNGKPSAFKICMELRK